MKKLFIAAFFSFFLTGCFASVQPVMEIPAHKKTTSFQIGKEQQANLGEPMVSEEDLLFYKGLVAIYDYQQPAQMGVTFPVIQKGTMFRLYAILNSGDKVYRSMTGATATIYTGEKVAWEYCLAVNAIGEAYGYSACTMAHINKWPAPVKFLSESEVYEKGSNKFELIYNGKSKDTIKLSYREFKDDFARAALYQDLTYDLAESKTIGFKNMKIEVIEVTNSYIKFIVRSPMN